MPWSHTPSTDGTTATAGQLNTVGEQVEYLTTLIESVTTLRPYVKLTRAAAQSISNNTEVAISWDQEDSDVYGMHTTGAATLVTIPAGAAGTYIVSFALCFDNTVSASGGRLAAVQLNGATVLESRLLGGNNFETLTVTPVLELVAGDQIRGVGLQTSGSTLATATTSTTRLIVAKL